LENVTTGVYFGWAVIEGTKKGRNICHKAVVNVGFSPTFEGQENAEKIVEAHLILDNEPIEDFYGETMRLQLHGFLRPEIKFPSFPALIAQITADVKEAKEALDLDPSLMLKGDTFLFQQDWMGRDGGNATGSWEFQGTDEAIEQLTSS